MVETYSLSAGSWQKPLKRTLRRLRRRCRNIESVAEKPSRLTESTDMVNAGLRPLPYGESRVTRRHVCLSATRRQPARMHPRQPSALQVSECGRLMNKRHV